MLGDELDTIPLLMDAQDSTPDCDLPHQDLTVFCVLSMSRDSKQAIVEGASCFQIGRIDNDVIDSAYWCH
jgi:hypothetical protein